MIIFIPILLLIGSSVFVILTNIWRRRFRSIWFIVAVVVLIVWLLVLLLRLRLPIEYLSPSLPYQGLSGFGIVLRLSDTNWSIAVSLITILLSIILTGIRNESPDGLIVDRWKNWSIGLAFIGISLIAVFAGNLYTLILAWAALDLLEFFFRIIYSKKGISNDRMFVAFGLRILSLVLLTIIGIIYKPSGFIEFSLSSANEQYLNWLLFSVLLRIMAILVLQSGDAIQGITSGVSTTFCLVSFAVCLMPVIHIASIDTTSSRVSFIYGFSVLAALIASLQVIFSKIQSNQTLGFVIGCASLVFASSIIHQPAASKAWLVVLLLIGGFSFINLNRHRKLWPILLLSTIGLCTLPLTPAWAGLYVYHAQVVNLNIYIYWPLVIFTQSFLISGFVKNNSSTLEPGEYLERWEWVIYAAGIAFLPITLFIIFILGEPGIVSGLEAFPSIRESWPGILACLLSSVYYLMIRRRYGGLPSINFYRPRIPVFQYLFKIYSIIYINLSRTVAFIDNLLEGAGGIMWTLLFLLLILALLIQTTS